MGHENAVTEDKNLSLNFVLVDLDFTFCWLKSPLKLGLLRKCFSGMHTSKLKIQIYSLLVLASVDRAGGSWS